MIEYEIHAAMKFIKSGITMSIVDHPEKVVTFDDKYFNVAEGDNRPELFTTAQFLYLFTGFKFIPYKEGTDV